MGKCIVLVSKSGYSDAHLSVLRQMLEKKIDLFCAVGEECNKWEDAIDWLAVELDVNGELPGAYCTTSAHPNETVEEVVEFAKEWNRLKGLEPDVDVIEI